MLMQIALPTALSSLTLARHASSSVFAVCVQ
jgi:hypothetical protein